jgi:glycosyltransferase involved in cell wall biosynthesis
VKHGFVVPVYRHGESAGPLAEKLASISGLPVIIVDDGNDEQTKKTLTEWQKKIPSIVLVSLKKNIGKGGAVAKGFEKAAELGLTHVFQVDADGQHDTAMTVFFLEESAKNPDKVICGFPVFDNNAPKSRVTGRRVSNFWAAVVTLSKELKDVLCGFRVYPLDAALRLTRNPLMDRRMGFDAEILVRLYWKKVFPIFHPIKVSYPEGGVSNFRVFQDNFRISWMFARLCLGMFLRFPMLITMRVKRNSGRK